MNDQAAEKVPHMGRKNGALGKLRSLSAAGTPQSEFWSRLQVSPKLVKS